MEVDLVLFNSLQFFIFLGAVWLCHRLARTGRQQNLIVLSASYAFYGAWDWRFLSLIWVSTAVDFAVARRIHDSTDPTVRRRLLGLSITVNLSILGFFKYAGFFIDSAGDALEAFGLSSNVGSLQILLPVGISFYTFQTISYTFDVYRERLAPSRDIVEFATYVAFFPQLVAGPIERARHLLPQLQRRRPVVGQSDLYSGGRLILLGLFKKVAIADAAAPVANAAFNDPSSTSATALVLGLLAFSIQIYGDFSGYTDIARGTARLFGVDLVKNFAQPYLSRNITEFWRRWHMSLSAWLHEYLYISLGGNKGGNARTYRNLMATMVLGGLWHGAAWTFVIWGVLHGSYLAVERAIGVTYPRGLDVPIEPRQVPAILRTLVLVSGTWIFFRADSLGLAVDYLMGILTLNAGQARPEDALLVAALSIAVLGVDLTTRYGSLGKKWQKQPVLQGASLGAMALGVLLWSGGSGAQFIYFQF